MECFDWAENHIQDRKAKIVKILVARPNDPKARMVFEVTNDGLFRTSGGRWIELSRLKRSCHG